ncbi:hypothetical protein BDDG_12002, partial [Blastomyces dermatitidis ATCC 18188]
SVFSRGCWKKPLISEVRRSRSGRKRRLRAYAVVAKVVGHVALEDVLARCHDIIVHKYFVPPPVVPSKIEKLDISSTANGLDAQTPSKRPQLDRLVALQRKSVIASHVTA